MLRWLHPELQISRVKHLRLVLSLWVFPGHYGFLRSSNTYAGPLVLIDKTWTNAHSNMTWGRHWWIDRRRGWRDGWMDRWMEGRREGWVGGLMDDRWVHEWMDRWMDCYLAHRWVLVFVYLCARSPARSALCVHVRECVCFVCVYVRECFVPMGSRCWLAIIKDSWLLFFPHSVQ